MHNTVEIWLIQKNIEVKCMVVREDESTENFSVRSLSMRGAQREITTKYVELGYKPYGRWEYTTMDKAEAVRRFN